MTEQLGLDVEIRAQMDRFERNMRAAGRLVDTTTTNMDKSTKRAAQAFDRLQGAIDPAARAALRLERDTAKVQRALDKGAISATRAADVQRRLNDQYERSSSGLGKMGTAQGQAAATSGRMGNAVQQAGYQVGDFAVQVASGQGVLRPFIQQGTQLVSMFGPWGAVIGAAGAVVGALATALISAGDEVDEFADSVLDAEERAKAYARTLAEVSGAVREFQKEVEDANQGLRSQAVLAIEAELAEADARLKDVTERARVVTERVNRAAANEAASGGAVPIPLKKQLENDRREQEKLNEEFEIAAQVVDSLNARLAILRNTLDSDNSGVTKSTKKVGDAFGELAEKARLARGSLDAFQQGGADELERYEDLAAALELANDAFEKYKNEINDGTKTFREFYAEAKTVVDATRELSEAQDSAAESAKRLKEAQDRVAEASKASAEEYAKVWDNAVEDVQDTITDGVRDALDGNLRDVQDWSRAFLNIVKDLAANLIAQRLVIPVVSGGASALGIPTGGAPGGGFNLNSLTSLLTGGTTPGGYSLVGAGGGTLGTSLFGHGGIFGTAYGPQLPGATGMFGAASPMLQGAFNNLSNPLNGPAGFAGNFIGSQLFEQSTGSSIGGTLGGIIGGMTPLGPVGAFLGAIAGNAIGGMFGTNPASVGPTGVAITGNVLNPTLDDLVTGTDNGGDASAAKAALEAISDAAVKIEEDLSGAVRNSSVFGLDVSYYPNPEPGSDGDKSAGFGLNEIINGVKRELDISGLTGEEVLAEGVIRTLRGAFETLGNGNIDAALENTAAESIEELLADLNLAQAIDDAANEIEADEPLTGVEQAFSDLADRIVEINEKVVELGLSSADAAVYIEDLNDALVEQVSDGFAVAIRAANGRGYLDAADALLDSRATNIRDAQAAGLNINDTAGELFDAQFRAFAGGLTLEQLRDLAADAEVAADAHASAIVSNTIAATAAEFAFASMTETLDDVAASADRAAENARRLTRAADGLLVNSSLSPLSPEARLEEARRQFSAAQSLAGGDPDSAATQDAIGQLPGLSETLLEASQAYYGSSEEYLAEFNRVQGALRDTAQAQRDLEAEQLSVLEQIRDALGGAANDNFGQGVTALANGQFTDAAGSDLGYQPGKAVAISNALAAAGYDRPSGFGEGQLLSYRSDPVANAIINSIDSRFADGGVFAGDMVSRPTAFSLGLMGEAGPEAIMPLSRGADGALGVRSSGGGSDRLLGVLVQRFDAMDARLAGIETNTAQQLGQTRLERARPQRRAG